MTAVIRDIADTVVLNNGVAMPRLGLGTYEAAGARVYDAVMAALEAGYRHIDTAAFYANERVIGDAVRNSGVPRDEIFVVTKLWNSDQGTVAARRGFEASFDKLDLGAIDQYLLHWPVPELRDDSWAVCAQLLADGRARSIGVSNFTIRHLEEMLDRGGVVPAVNQVELHPFLHQRDLLEYCRQHGIRVVAYSPLVKAQRLHHPELAEIAARHGKSSAQVLIRWSLQHDLVVIPKSATPERIRENAEVYDFALDAAELAALDALDEGYRTSWDPTDEP